MLKHLFLLFLIFYRYCISPVLGTNCRFYPTCSEYSYLVVQKYGFFKGGYLTIRRLLKCHPWHSGGLDYPS